MSSSTVDGDRVSPADPRAVGDRLEFATHLTALRTAQGISVRQLAKNSGVPLGTVSGYLTGRNLPSVTQLAPFHAVLLALGLSDPTDLEAWTDALRRVRKAPGPRPASAHSPYKGLACFELEDADWFYGRDETVSLAVAAIAARAGAAHPGPVAVIGPSGSGKSSILRAGVIRRAVAGEIPGITHASLMTPGEHPLKAFESVSTGEPGELLVVDQFEETFTLCADADERAEFIELLCGAPADGPARSVVLGMRSDFYSAAARELGLVAVLQDAQIVVGPMSVDELRQAICEPARQAGLVLHSELVERVLTDLGARPTLGHSYDAGALPLLSHALRMTWHNAQRNELTVDDYVGTGGIYGAVQQSAELLFDELSGPEQDEARHVFLRAVTVDDEGVATRRRIKLTDLPESALTIARVFTQYRLLTADEDGIDITHEALLTAWPRLREWIETDRDGLRLHQRLADSARDWQDSGRDAGALLRAGRLDAIGEWAGDPDHRSAMSPLEHEFYDLSRAAAVAEETARRRRSRVLQQLLAGVAVLALAAGVLAAIAVQQRGVAVHQRATARTERDVATSRQLATVAGQLRAKDPALAALLSLAAYRISPTVDARSSLMDSYAVPTPARLVGPAGPMQAVAVSRTGSLLAAACADATVRLWTLSNGHASQVSSIPVGAAGTLFALALTDDSRTMAVAGKDRTVYLFDVSTPSAPKALGRLTGAGNTIYGLAFDNGGRTLYAASADDVIHRWQLGATPTEQAPLRGFTSYVQSIALDAASRTLAAGGKDGTVRLWDLTKPSAVHPVTTIPGIANDIVYSVAVSRDGRTLAAGYQSGIVQLWNIADVRHPKPVANLSGEHTSWVNSLAFSSTGSLLASGSSDDSLVVYDLGQKRVVATFRNPTPITSIAFNSEGNTILAGSTDGIARIWPVPGPVLTGPQTSVFAAAFTPDSRYVALDSGSNAPAVWMWDVTNPQRPVQVTPPITLPPSVGKLNGTASVSADGSLLAVGGPVGRVWLWDISSPLNPRRLAVTLQAGKDGVEGTSFSPNGRLLAVASDDYQIHLFDVSNPASPVALPALAGLGNEAYTVAFRADSHVVVGGGADGNAVMWDVTDPAHAHQLAMIKGFNSYVYTTAFSHDGTVLAVGGGDTAVHLYDVRTPDKPIALGQAILGPNSYVAYVSFSPDDTKLAVASLDGVLRIWDIRNRAHPVLYAELKAAGAGLEVVTFNRAGNLLVGAGVGDSGNLWLSNPDAVASWVCASQDGLTRQEWATYLPSVPYRSIC